VKALPREDQRQLHAAQAWLELGNHLEANEEPEQITAENRALERPSQPGKTLELFNEKDTSNSN
jgi:hypothetical protein